MPTTKDNEQTTTETTETKPQSSTPPAKAPLPEPGKNPPYPITDPPDGKTASTEE